MVGLGRDIENLGTIPEPSDGHTWVTPNTINITLNDETNQDCFLCVSVLGVELAQ